MQLKLQTGNMLPRMLFKGSPAQISLQHWQETFASFVPKHAPEVPTQEYAELHTQNCLPENWAGMTVKNWKVSHSFIVRFLKLQEIISPLNNALLLMNTIQSGYSARLGNVTGSRFSYHRLALRTKLFSALPAFDGDWESIRLMPAKKTKGKLMNDMQKKKKYYTV